MYNASLNKCWKFSALEQSLTFHCVEEVGLACYGLNCYISHIEVIIRVNGSPLCQASIEF